MQREEASTGKRKQPYQHFFREVEYPKLAKWSVYCFLSVAARNVKPPSKLRRQTQW